MHGELTGYHPEKPTLWKGAVYPTLMIVLVLGLQTYRHTGCGPFLRSRSLLRHKDSGCHCVWYRSGRSSQGNNGPRAGYEPRLPLDLYYRLGSRAPGAINFGRDGMHGRVVIAIGIRARPATYLYSPGLRHHPVTGLGIELVEHELTILLTRLLICRQAVPTGMSAATVFFYPDSFTRVALSRGDYASFCTCAAVVEPFDGWPANATLCGACACTPQRAASIIPAWTRLQHRNQAFWMVHWTYLTLISTRDSLPMGGAVSGAASVCLSRRALEDQHLDLPMTGTWLSRLLLLEVIFSRSDVPDILA